MSASLPQGTTWERICDTIELQNSWSKTIARPGPNATGLARFKGISLRLRRKSGSALGVVGCRSTSGGG